VVTTALARLATPRRTSHREQQLANIRRIHGPAKEALGVLAIEIELVG
jgi:hypothetical protein